jgi:hypothetical protein
MTRLKLALLAATSLFLITAAINLSYPSLDEFRFASSPITTNQEILMMSSLLEKGIVEANEDLLDEILDEQFIDDLNGQRSSRQQLKAKAKDLKGKQNQFGQSERRTVISSDDSTYTAAVMKHFDQRIDFEIQIDSLSNTGIEKILHVKFVTNTIDNQSNKHRKLTSGRLLLGKNAGKWCFKSSSGLISAID